MQPLMQKNYHISFPEICFSSKIVENNYPNIDPRNPSFSQKFGFTVEKVFDVEKNGRDLQREKFSKFLKKHF
jgi:hypothetical protein